MGQRDGEQASGIKSGTSEKAGFHKETPESHGMGSVGQTVTKDQPGPLPAPNPSKKVSEGHTIK